MLMQAHGETPRTIKEYKAGTHRGVPPSETLARVRPFLASMGITRLANVTGLDSIGVPVVMACRPNSRSLAVAQGKGLDLDAAKASAVMESLETYHAENVNLPLRLATYRELQAGDAVVDVERIPRQSDSAFHPDLRLLWVEGDDWMRRERVWAPYGIVHTAYTTGMRSDLGNFQATSTGLASGNHFLEAASHAICEIVERDAGRQFALLSEDERESRRLDLTTVDDPDSRTILELYSRAGVMVGVHEITSDVGLPVFQCDIIDREEDPVRPICAAGGMGCHPVRHIALLRALTEAAQGRLTLISGARDDLARRTYAYSTDPVSTASLRRRLAREGTKPFRTAPSFEHDTFEEDVALELTLLRAAGLDRVILYDLTLPTIGFPVVRALIPGMAVSVEGAFVRTPASIPS